ncbi:bzip transcription factor [Diplodia corticola]|uniref:Bzip transcription factor n=1 Tax=Diplodia corticola TaxID=236234 RepID=A0A1J9R744_9PEZI|nr:bzip transcription factor [Diplodia corticola]OJD37334.1 bzip transcription factor [Diplodia corticola]
MTPAPHFDRHGVADPMLLHTELGSLLSDAFLSTLPNAGPSPDMATPPNDCKLQGSLAQSVSTHQDGPFPGPSMDTKGQQRTSGARKAAKRKKAQCPTQAGTPNERARREVNLEKNRLAANRCRRKKRDWTDKLEDRHRNLSVHNQLLHAEISGLRDDIFALKDMALRHADCGFRPIDDYVKREAERVRAQARGSCDFSSLPFSERL